MAVCVLRQRAARDQHASHAHIGGALEDSVAIEIEAVVRQIDADVQQRWRVAKWRKSESDQPSFATSVLSSGHEL